MAKRSIKTATGGGDYENAIQVGRELYDTILEPLDTISEEDWLEEAFLQAITDLLDALGNATFNEAIMLAPRISFRKALALAKLFELRRTLRWAQQRLRLLANTKLSKQGEEEVVELISLFRVPLEEWLILARC